MALSFFSLFNSAVSNTIEYTATPAYADIVQNEVIEESPIDRIKRIEEEYHLKKDILYNLALSESNLGEKRIGDNGKSCGLVHIHMDYFPEENKNCDNDEATLRFAAQLISDKKEYLFTPCNCYSYSKIFVKNLPKMVDIQPNSSYPRVGGIIIFYYHSVKHIAVITKVTAEGIHIKEANFEACKVGVRVIKWDDINIVGFASYND